jgi:hypothetical protein
MKTDELEYEWGCMRKQELALLYAPDLTPHAAVNRLMDWVRRNPNLCSELEKSGYRKTAKMLSARQVRLIVYFLGEP